jgi:hypothetical protein
VAAGPTLPVTPWTVNRSQYIMVNKTSVGLHHTHGAPSYNCPIVLTYLLLLTKILQLPWFIDNLITIALIYWQSYYNFMTIALFSLFLLIYWQHFHDCITIALIYWQYSHNCITIARQSHYKCSIAIDNAFTIILQLGWFIDNIVIMLLQILVYWQSCYNVLSQLPYCIDNTSLIILT